MGVVVNHISANELKTHSVAVMEQALAEGRADVAADRVVRESAEAHLARLDTSHNCDDQACPTHHSGAAREE